LALLSCAAALPADDHRPERYSATLMPTQEVPAVSSVATGHFSAVIDESAQTINYTVSYEGLEGNVTQSHIHFGQMGVSGGISLWLCGTTATPAAPAGTPVCPAPAGSVTGVLMAAQVVGPANQGIAVGEFAEIIAAIRSGFAYANVHSSKLPSGEVRGQIRRGGERDEGRHD
jgi:hypothetical protein